ncbi:MAG: hypothetical protein NVSMB38_06760 [Ktedonobacteraceae bacterium]
MLTDDYNVFLLRKYDIFLKEDCSNDTKQCASIISTVSFRLNTCIPLVGPEALKLAMYNTAHLGQDVCETLATQHGWDWSREAAEAVLHMLEKQETVL